MFSRYRQRRGPYALAEPSPIAGLVRRVAALVVVGLILYWTGGWILWLFGAGNEVQRTSVLLMAEAHGPVNVSLEGGAVQRAQDNLKLYPGDRVATGGNGHGTLLFFDGSRARLDQQTDVQILESTRGTEQSTVSMRLSRGALLIRTPSLEQFSGSVLRRVSTPAMTLVIPAGTEVLLAERSLQVFASETLGVEVDLEGGEPVYIGEGQGFMLPANADPQGNLYTYRSALSADAATAAFVNESRRAMSGGGTVQTAAGGSLSDEILAITYPPQDTVATSATVKVSGKIGKGVVAVRVNGYPAVIDASRGAFNQEITLHPGTVTDVRIEALDDKGLLLAEDHRQVTMQAKVVAPPKITLPAMEGQTYRTTQAEFEIRGTATSDVTGILVNDYRLQLYKPGSGAWSYLASTKLGNLLAGKNVFNVFALDRDGNRSQPATLTILIEEGPEGVVVTAPSGFSSAPATPIIDPAKLPQNAPLQPGTLTVTGPTPGTAHTATGSEILIEGATSADTATIWVNDYKLQLFKPGKTTWNYIAKVAFQNMKKGTNVYAIVARNAKDEILDKMEYTVTVP